MAPVAQKKLKLYAPRVGRGASPSLRRRRRAFYATAAFRAFSRGDQRMAQAHVAFALNNGARLGDLARAGRQVIKDEAQLDGWLALLNASPSYSARARLMQMSKALAQRYGAAPFSEVEVGVVVGDNDPQVAAQEAMVEQSLATNVANVPADLAGFYGEVDPIALLPEAGTAPMTAAQRMEKMGYWTSPAASIKAKLAHEYYDESDYRQAYYMGSDWRQVTDGKTAVFGYNSWKKGKRGACLISAKSQRDSQGRPYPPKDAQFGSAEFDLWVAALCNPETQNKARELEAERLVLRAQEWSGLNATVDKMVKYMEETKRQQQMNLDAAFKGLPLPYNAPPYNAPNTTSIYVLPPNYAVPGLPVHPSSWKGDFAAKGPPAPLGAIAGQVYTPPPTAAAGPPQQVVDPVTGQVMVVPAPAGTSTSAYPGGPATPTYPTQPGQTYPGYTPPPPKPAEESLEPKKKKKKSSMTLPLVLGVGALSVGALVVIRSRR